MMKSLSAETIRFSEPKSQEKIEAKRIDKYEEGNKICSLVKLSWISVVLILEKTSVDWWIISLV